MDKEIVNDTVKLAAKGCYYPIVDEEKKCMAWVIELLVMPDGKESYTSEEMEIYIEDAIKKIKPELFNK